MKKCRYGFQLYNSKDSFVGRSFSIYGEYAESEVSVFKRLIKEGQSVIDVGAYIGSHTVPFSRLVGDKGSVMAFEPERLSYHCLCGTMALNGIKNVQCFQQALGAKPGFVDVPELDDNLYANLGGTSLSQNHSNDQTYKVLMYPLDAVVNDCHFIKIDVEGMESDVLAGAVKTIERCRPILYVDEHSEGLKDEIEHMGYNVHVQVSPVFNPSNYYEDPRNVFIINDQVVVSINLICLPMGMECPFTTSELSALAGKPA